MEDSSVIDANENLVHSQVKTMQQIETIVHNSVTQGVRTVALIIKVTLVEIELWEVQNRIVSS